MPIGILFWVLMVLWAAAATWRDWGNQWAIGGNLLQWVLFGLLGWKVFGPILQ